MFNLAAFSFHCHPLHIPTSKIILLLHHPSFLWAFSITDGLPSQLNIAEHRAQAHFYKHGLVVYLVAVHDTPPQGIAFCVLRAKDGAAYSLLQLLHFFLLRLDVPAPRNAFL